VEIESAPVAIIGGGPAGLALGWQLQQRGVSFVILEKGAAGESWNQMPRTLKLVSPWKWNWLTPETRAAFPPNAQLSREEFLSYLRALAATHALPIHECSVEKVERVDDSFRLHTSRGEIRASIVVNASGYFSNPLQLALPGEATTRIPRVHFAHYRDAAHVAKLAGANRSVLVVGKRLSAGQVALELADAGMKVAISHRTPIRFGVDDWLWPLVYRNFAYAEALRLMCGSRGGPLDVRMPGGRVRKLIERGEIKTFPAIARFTDDAVVFDDGQTFQPGVVLYATGFVPALRHLEALPLTRCSVTNVPLTRDMESVSEPNLFFLGFEMLRNFQSRFLRGIRKDAVTLSDIIARRAAHLPESQPSASIV
jgi:putative flavoprotein involved in K+ transport